MDQFTPLSGLIGGIMIGLAAALYLLSTGRLAGISGMLESVLRPTMSGFGLAAAFLAGLPIGAILVAAFAPQVLKPVMLQFDVVTLIVAGLLVGFGTRLANGCTSGHGVCGLPRFSVRSMAATGVFMLAAMVTVFITRHVF